MQQSNQHPVFSTQAAVGPAVPQTSELEPIGRHAPSAVEDDTKHLPQSEPPREISR